ncbi:MAG: 3'-5' exonuclease [Aquificaceae bacterium]|nr:3'-5' exonuclease [Aquificaceae bacterium]MDW8237651.1 3'-5' exonuclease [Aquificaceae bacterium]
MRELLLESAFVSLDIEATGIDPQTCEIIEVACVRVEGGIITEEFSTLVNPGHPLPSRIVQLTGITNAMLVGRPSAFEIFPQLESFIKNQIIVAHRAEKDIAFMDRIYRRLYKKRFRHPYICTYHLARNILPELKRYSLKDLALYFNIQHGRAHRARDDARTTALVFLELLKILWNRLGIGDYLHIKRLSKGA